VAEDPVEVPVVAGGGNRRVGQQRLGHEPERALGGGAPVEQFGHERQPDFLGRVPCLVVGDHQAAFGFLFLGPATRIMTDR